LQQQPIVFFDGVCGLCNTAVDVLLRADRHHRLIFAPLQGETAQRLLHTPAHVNETAEPSFDTIVLLDAAGRHEKSDAALRICRHLGGFWRMWLAFYVLPEPIRDALYSFVARHRYAWFGKKDTCRLPTPEERQRFLP
jgi:predicted DCC family thiol-disulfide oxidoreductase YuxK